MLAWHETDQLPPDFNPIDAVHGDPGWVMVGVCGPPTCPEYSTPAAWQSGDGLTWQRVDLPDDTASLNIDWNDVDWNGAYWATGIASDRSTGQTHAVAVVWRSDDGLAWDRVAELDLGECIEGCPVMGGVVAWKHGLFIEWADFVDQSRAGPYRSVDGREWSRVDPRSLGVDVGPISIDGVALGDEIVVAATEPEGPTVVSRSRDGAYWTRLGELQIGGFGPGTRIATDGSRLVIAVERCVGDSCTTRLWSSTDVGAWTDEPVVLDITHPRIAFDGERFVVAGVAPDLVRTYTSEDGLDWTAGDEIPSDGCDSIEGLAGGDGLTFLWGDPECPVWAGRW